MADILINQLRDGSTTIPPGQSIPSSDRSRLLALGAVIWPDSDPYVAAASRDALAALARGDVAAAQRLMIIGVIRSLKGTMVPGWNTVSQVFVDYAVGSNANDGLTAVTPLADLDEYGRRLGDQIIDAAVTPMVRISVKGSKQASFRFAPRTRGFVVIWVVGTRAPLTVPLSGTLTTFQGWNAGTKTQCEFSFSGLPTSWTASGAVGRFLSLPSLGSVSLVVGKDLGSNTALSCGPFDTNNFEPVVGSAVGFEAYTVNAITGDSIEFAPEGEGIVIVQDLELSRLGFGFSVRGNSQVTFLGCRLFGCEGYNFASTGAFCCYVDGWRNFARDLLQSNVHDSTNGPVLGPKPGGISDLISNVLCLGGSIVERGGSILIENDASSYGGSIGLLCYGRGRISGSFWARNASANIIQAAANAGVDYADASLIGSTGTAPSTPYACAGASGATLPQVNAARLSGIVLG